MSTLRALVQIDDATAALMEVRKGQQHCGAYTDDGLMVMRPAWKHEYAYPLGEPQTLALAVYKDFQPQPAPRPRAAPQRRARRLPAAKPVPIGAEPGDWRTGRVAQALLRQAARQGV